MSACSFIPTQILAGNTATNVTVSVATASPPAGTPPGNYTITINAMSGPASHLVLAGLTVTSQGALDFSVTNTSGPQTVTVGTAANYVLNFSPVGGSTFANSVAYSCLASPSSCTFTPVSPIVAGKGSTNVTLSIPTTSLSAGNYTATVTAMSGSASHIVRAGLTVTAAGFDFTVINNTSPVTITAGQVATYSLEVNPSVLGNIFPNNVALSCSGLPGVSTCAFAPTQVASGSGNTNVMLTITTTAAVPGSSRSVRILNGSLTGLWLPLPGIVVIFAGFVTCNPVRKKIAGYAVLGLVLLLVIFQAGCGGLGGGGSGAGQPGTPQGNYTVTVTATMGSISRTAQVQLTVQP